MCAFLFNQELTLGMSWVAVKVVQKELNGIISDSGLFLFYELRIPPVA